MFSVLDETLENGKPRSNRSRVASPNAANTGTASVP